MNNSHVDQPLPVTRSLCKTLRLLARPLDELESNKLAFQPSDIVLAINANHRVVNREQQDAHELFQLLSGALDSEDSTAATRSGRYADTGLKDLLGLSSVASLSPAFSGSTSIFTSGKLALSGSTITKSASFAPATANRYDQSQHYANPFTGLLANRLSCVKCGYTVSDKVYGYT